MPKLSEQPGIFKDMLPSLVRCAAHVVMDKNIIRGDDAAASAAERKKINYVRSAVLAHFGVESPQAAEAYPDAQKDVDIALGVIERVSELLEPYSLKTDPAAGLHAFNAAVQAMAEAERKVPERGALLMSQVYQEAWRVDASIKSAPYPKVTSNSIAGKLEDQAIVKLIEQSLAAFLAKGDPQKERSLLLSLVGMKKNPQKIDSDNPDTMAIQRATIQMNYGYPNDMRYGGFGAPGLETADKKAAAAHAIALGLSWPVDYTLQDAQKIIEDKGLAISDQRSIMEVLLAHSGVQVSPRATGEKRL